MLKYDSNNNNERVGHRVDNAVVSSRRWRGIVGALESTDTRTSIGAVELSLTVIIVSDGDSMPGSRLSWTSGRNNKKPL